MKIRKFSYQLLVFLLLSLCFLTLKPANISAKDCVDYDCSKSANDENPIEYQNCLNAEKSCWESKITETKSQANTLQSAINILNGQIQLQSVKIQQTTNEIYQLEKEIDELTQRIEGLSISLDKLSGILIERIRASYKQSRKQYKANFFVSDSFNDFITQYRYLNQAQEQTLEVMRRTELQRATYDQQKQLKEEKQAEVSLKKSDLERQKAELDVQKKSKDILLQDTKNSEIIYQQKLAEAVAELEAIRGIIAGLGEEIKIGKIEAGDKIASVIVGKSACSTGTHLHFEVVKDEVRYNPFQLLKNIDLIWSNIDPPKNGTGDWSWPLSNPIRVTQDYGYTSYSSRYTNSLHTGIDIVSDDTTVKATKSGELFQGSMRCGGGNLFYVRVKQDDGFDTYYLHVYY